MILGISGEVSTGKTTFAYTAPGKVIGFSFDLGADRAIYGTQYDGFFKGKNIVIVPYKAPTSNPMTNPDIFKGEVLQRWNDEADILVFELPQPIQLDERRVHGALELWSYFMVLLGKSVQDDSVRSVVLDTATQARRLKADAYLQELQERELDKNSNSTRLRKQLIQIEWGHPNDTIRTIYTMFKGIGKNLITIHHLQDERAPTVNRDGTVEDKLTGKRIVNEGSVNPDQQWDIGITTIKNGATVTAKYLKCGFNLRLEGMTVGTGVLNWNSMIDEVWGSLDNRPELSRVLERA